MTFQEFKDKIESEFIKKYAFELLEYQYLPYSFGHGILAYRIKEFNYKFIYDGRDNSLTCQKSDRHTSYSDSSWTEIFFKEGLNLTETEFDKIVS